MLEAPSKDSPMTFLKFILCLSKQVFNSSYKLLPAESSTLMTAKRRSLISVLFK
jgi:hypothetical protein